MKATASHQLLLVLLLASIQKSNAAQYGSCDGCHCITAADNEECPKQPRTDYSRLIPKLTPLTWANPTYLQCNPYDETNPCDTLPEPLSQGGGACVIDIIPPVDTEDECPANWGYATRTYEGTFDEAVSAGELITHEGPCGLCSSLQDLVVYMEKGPDLDAEAGQCGIVAASNPTNPFVALQCFKDIGFTDGCSSAWFFNVVNTFSACLETCLPFLQTGAPPNGPAPTCELADCLVCDETSSGPKFLQFAGRTRRNSALLSNVARPCEDLISFKHKNPCKGKKKMMMGSGTSKSSKGSTMNSGESKTSKGGGSKRRTKKYVRKYRGQ